MQTLMSCIDANIDVMPIYAQLPLTIDSGRSSREYEFHLTLSRKAWIVTRVVQISLAELQGIVRNSTCVKLASKYHVACRAWTRRLVVTLDENVASQLKARIERDAYVRRIWWWGAGRNMSKKGWLENQLKCVSLCNYKKLHNQQFDE